MDMIFHFFNDWNILLNWQSVSWFYHLLVLGFFKENLTLDVESYTEWT